jgi:branched-chain amino acid transport system ATP-binding protein
MLEARDVVAGYGASLVVQGVSFDVAAGEVVCLLGRNGVGKTTTLRAVMGIVPPRSGRVVLRGEDITGGPPFRVARQGLGYVPDDRRIFADLTVEENLEITRRVVRREGRWNLDRVYRLFPDLQRLRRMRGDGLSGGEQKMLAIGRALTGNPSLLILDEPSEGLSPLLVRALVGAIGEIRQEGVTLLLADQNLKFARRVADRGYILEKGRVRYTGRLDELWADQEVVRKYLAV